jgi:hypothetical protein
MYTRQIVSVHYAEKVKMQKSKAIPLQAQGFQEDEATRVQDNLHIKVARLSALHIGRLYPSATIPGTHCH